MFRFRSPVALFVSLLTLRAATLRACSGCPRPSFQGAGRMLPSDFQANAVVTGDFNEDGNLDIVFVAGPYPTGLVFFAGNSDGRFSPPVTTVLPSGAYYFSAVAGDFDGDGHLDIVVGTNDVSHPELHFFRGLGNGTFLPPKVTPVPFSAQRITAGDFDGDGRLDVATTPIYNFGNSVTIEFGDGQGGFASTRSVFIDTQIFDLKAADLNGDGVTDLVVTHNAPTFSVVLGGSRSSIGPAVEHVGTGQSIAAFDFNGDGKIDLAISNYSQIVLLTGLGDGNFVLAQTLTVPGGGLFAADFNGDGHMDLLSFGQEDHLLLGDGSGSFTDVQQTKGTISGLPVVGDFNRDGFADLAIAGNGLMTLLSGRGSPFLLPSSVPPDSVFYPGGPGSTVVADFTGDGIPDLATTSYVGIEVRPGNGMGGYGPPIETPVKDLRFAVALPADMNGDGRMDLLILDGLTLGVMLGDGHGSFSQPAYYAASGSEAIAVGDFDGDGRLDVALNAGLSREQILLGDGLGGFRSFAFVNDGLGASASSLIAGDFNGDGKLDLAVVGTASSTQIRILLGTGNGSFTPGPLTELPAAIQNLGALLAADFNQDNRLDLALIAGSVWIMTNDGTGAFGNIERYGQFSERRMGLADLDGNGLLDILILESNSSLGSVLYNTNCESRHVVEEVEESSCNVVGSVFGVQPQIGVYDDGGNRVVCDGGTVTASLVSGPAGAVLGGTRSVGAVSGLAIFTDLLVDRAGAGYQMEFAHPVAGKARSLRFTAGLGVSVQGPAQMCVGTAAMFSAGAGYDTYVWEVDGVVVASAGSTLSVAGFTAGLHTVMVTVKKDRCLVSASKGVDVQAGPSATVSAPAAVCPFSSGNTASVPDGGAGASYSWTVSNGVITGGQGTPTITFRTGPYGQAVLTATVTKVCSTTGTRAVAINPTLSCAGPQGFFTVTPCRLIDTRGADGPALSPGVDRTFGIVGRCGIPSTATALSVNIAVTQPTGVGFLILRPGSTPLPLASLLNYRAGQTRANNAIVSMGAAGDLTATCGQPPGSVHLVLDVNGYFQ
jgi:hypothetical protein